MFELFSNQDLFSDIIISSDYNNAYDPSIHKTNKSENGFLSTLGSYASDLLIMSYTLPLMAMNATFSYAPSMKMIA
ncbi:hypothetical protein HDV02_006783 [Globomyces sp. JEL0801]|nr:hypothetical protein HDV02_006783 [Globomyces sp. JEL0801]